MEKTHEEILSEIRQEISELRSRLAGLEERLAGLEGESTLPVDDEPVDMAAIEISIDDIIDVDFSDSPVEFSAESEPVMESEAVAEPEPVMEPEAVAEPAPVEPEAAAEPAVEPSEPSAVSAAEPADPDAEPAAPVAEPEQEKEESLADIFGGFAASDEGTLNAKHRVHQKKAVIDAMTADEAWRKDIPGSAVKNVLSAISLNDRILFIRSLFDEDAAAFSSMAETVNSSESFEQAVDAIKEAHPEWDYNSDTVYRFMMAVRRRLR